MSNQSKKIQLLFLLLQQSRRREKNIYIYIVPWTTEQLTLIQQSPPVRSRVAGWTFGSNIHQTVNYSNSFLFYYLHAMFCIGFLTKNHINIQVVFHLKSTFDLHMNAPLGIICTPLILHQVLWHSARCCHRRLDGLWLKCAGVPTVRWQQGSPI